MNTNISKILALCMVIGVLGIGAAAAAPTVLIDPASTPGLAPGDEFQINISVDPDGNGLASGDIRLSFDASVLAVTDLESGDLLGANPLGLAEYDNDAGTITAAYSRKGATTPPTPAGTWATITFEVKTGVADCMTDIDITSVGLANEIPEAILGITTTNGTATIGAAVPTLTVFTVDPATVTQGGTVDIDIEFSEEVDWAINVNNSTVATVELWSGTSTNPTVKHWDTTTDTPTGDYTVDVFMNGALVDTETVTVEAVSIELIYGVTISQPDDQTTTEGVNANYLLTVMNTGNVADTYTLDVTNVDGATTAALNMTSIALDAGASGVVALDVTSTTAGTFNVTVSATSQTDDANATTGYIMTTVEAASTELTYGVTISQPDDQTTTEGVNANYLLTVMNTGTVADTYTLDVTNVDGATTAALNMTTIALDAGASGVVALDVTNTTAGTFNVTVSATSANATNTTGNIMTTVEVASAAAAPTVIIDPASTPGLAPGDEFQINISVDPDGNGLASGDIRLSFDASVLAVTDLESGDLLGANPLGLAEYDNDAGTITAAYSRKGATTPPTPAGTWATITFEVKTGVADCTTDIDITSVGLANEIPAAITGITTTNGTATIGTAGPTLTVFTVDPATVTQGGTVDIDIEFSEEVSWVINVNNSTVATVELWSGTSTNPTVKHWDTTTDTPAGDYTVDVFMNGALVDTETVTVEVALTEPTYGVTISQPDDQTTTEGVNANYLLTVMNTGTVADTYTLDVTNVDGATTAALNMTSIALDAGASGVVALDVTNTTAGTFNVTVNATSLNATNTTGNIMTTVVGAVSAEYGVTISQPEDQTTTEGVNANYLLTVMNTGTVADTYTLDVTNVDGATTAALNMTSIALDAGASGVVALDVTNTTAGTFNVTVNATSLNATNTTGNIMTTVVGAVSAEYGVTISQPEDQTTTEGVNANYLLTVMNTGTVADTYTLDVTNVDGATTAALNMTSIALDAGASGVVALDVTNTTAGTFNVTVNATSLNATNTTGNIMTTVVGAVSAEYGVTISQPEDQTTTEGVNANYLLTVMNTGTVADTYTLDVTNVDGATTAALNMTSIALDAGASGVVALDVTNTTAGTFNVTVNATSLNATNTTGNIMTTVVGAVSAEYGVTISQPEDQTTTEGVNANYLLTVMNTGTVADTYTLDVTNVDGATTAALNMTSIALDAGASGVVALDVTNTTAGTFNVTVNATSLNATNTTGNIMTTVVGAVSAEYGVTISQPEDQTTTEGVNANYLLTVMNTGTVADTYTLDVTNVDGATTAALNMTSIALDAGASGVVALDVTNTTAGTFNVTVNATSLNATNTTGNIMTTVVGAVSAEYGVTISQPDDQTTTEGVNANYLLTVMNTGNVADTYTLDVTNVDGATTAALNMTSIALDAGASGVVALDVTNTTAGTFNVTVNATSLNATNTTGNITTTVEVSAAAAPTITSSDPTSPVSDIAWATRTFSIEIDQTVNVTWLIDDRSVQTDGSVTDASYTNTSAVPGFWNVSAVAENENGTDMQTWWWNVAETDSTFWDNETSLTVPSGDTNVTVNVTGNFDVNVSGWVNVTPIETVTDYVLNGTAGLGTGYEFISGVIVGVTDGIDDALNESNGTVILTMCVSDDVLDDLGIDRSSLHIYAYNLADTWDELTTTTDGICVSADISDYLSEGTFGVAGKPPAAPPADNGGSGGSGGGTYPPGWDDDAPAPTPTATTAPTDATPEPTEAPTDEAPTEAPADEAPTETPTKETEMRTPGFGAALTVFAIAGLLVATYLVMRRRE